MDFKRIATIIGVAVIGYVGFYIAEFLYNLIIILFVGSENTENSMAILTGIIVAIIYTVKTRRQ